MEAMIAEDGVAKSNQSREKAMRADYAALGEQLDRRGIAIDAILKATGRLPVVEGKAAPGERDTSTAGLVAHLRALAGGE